MKRERHLIALRVTMALAAALSWVGPLAGAPLTISYIERAPYYFTDKGQPTGTLLESFAQFGAAFARDDRYIVAKATMDSINSAIQKLYPDI